MPWTSKTIDSAVYTAGFLVASNISRPEVARDRGPHGIGTPTAQTTKAMDRDNSRLAREIRFQHPDCRGSGKDSAHDELRRVRIFPGRARTAFKGKRLEAHC